GLAIIAGLGGCTNDTQTSATKEEQSRWQNPVKEPPPEAGNMGGPPKGGTAGGPPLGAPPGPPPGAQAGPG
ncbi:MAG: hypothetical protein SFX74_12780, partial [Fimbriimonadaceae bacterium]|nr:hypothetical protein [Fimbriimonadaceae bacterium]